ncbi:stalk domain-containing protein [Paenibacillus aestuarii]|uniref:Stalk domain-containing protein n=1 Tax=Paenibacillus aestuarii TaxID=516965 RepID=A0ABW0K6E6_9BACL|nr:stalk domain-containing protein [Paenibacillus aestuarii]
MKKLLTVTLILFFISSTVNASSTHGDYEGSPIVSVHSNGQELKVEDVPAINYKGRTMVPIYMLRQLGADVAWNDATYSVNVSINKEQPQVANPDTAQNVALMNAYKWLSDTDQQLYIFASKIKEFKDLDQVPNITDILDRDYVELTEEYNKSLAFANEVKKQNSTDTTLTEIIASQSKVLDAVGQTKDLFKIWVSRKTDLTINTSLQMSMFTSIENSQKNIMNTNKYVHTTFEQK